LERVLKVDLFLAAFSAATGTIAVVSLLIGTTPYLGFFRRNFMARRKWDPGHYWSMVVQYVVVCVICAVAAVFLPTAR
jgi:hypothetical protein